MESICARTTPPTSSLLSRRRNWRTAATSRGAGAQRPAELAMVAYLASSAVATPATGGCSGRRSGGITRGTRRCAFSGDPAQRSPPPVPLQFPQRIGPLFWPWEKVKVGSLTVSPMGFGTWAWGNQLLWGYQERMDNDLQEIFNLAVRNGVTLFDTADSYGTGRLNGQSESLLGKFIREFPGEYIYEGSKAVRDNIVIATKFAAYPWRLTSGQFVKACKSSLDRLQVEQIGIGQLHWSSANYAPLQELALWDGLVAMYEKVQFSLLSMGKEQMELKGVCDSLGICLISYSPLGLGMLSGKYTASKLPRGPRAFLFRQILPGLDPLLRSLRDIAKMRGKTVSQVAINWCICKGTVPIPGVKTVWQAEENLGALGWRLSSDEILELESAAMDSPRKMIQNIFQTR
uniref:Putative oxidoreductase At1g06690, chloroplastic n=1 Tax=Anthurium amnicola TaxID=1678845 RepID=A0A1D1XQX5_9ARAE